MDQTNLMMHGKVARSGLKKYPRFKSCHFVIIKDALALDIAHVSWLKGADIATVDQQLVTSIFKETGGVYRTLIESSTAAASAIQEFRETPSFGWTVLSIIFQAQNRLFDPFMQSSVSSSHLLFEMDAIGDPKKFAMIDLHQLVDAGVLFLDDNNRGSFLLPVHYDHILKGVVPK